MSLNFTFSQEVCDDFNTGTDEWGCANCVNWSDDGNPRADGTNYMRARDENGPSTVNKLFFPTLDLNCVEICFDYKVFDDGDDDQVISVNPRLIIESGIVADLRAIYIHPVTVTENST